MNNDTDSVGKAIRKVTIRTKVINGLKLLGIKENRKLTPEEMSKLKIEKGKDYCTLVTCTPYGVNTHRLLVRGIRIPYTEQKEIVAKEETSNTHSQWMEEYTKSIIIAAIAFITLLLSLIHI